MGNRVSDSKAVGLAEAIESIVEHLAEYNLREIVLVFSASGYGRCHAAGPVAA
jgi:hypothetical protein